MGEIAVSSGQETATLRRGHGKDLVIWKRTTWTALLAWIFAACSDSPDPTGPGPDDPTRPNFLIILTDDQDTASVRLMPNVQRLLAREGATFTNAFVTTSTCCPSRVSLLTGKYAHNHGVLTNEAPLGGFWLAASNGAEMSTVATWLDEAGYRTGFFGKYLNEYKGEAYTHVPPGWDAWYAYIGGYWNKAVSVNGTSTPIDGYMTDYFAERVRDFVGGGGPFLAVYATWAPHDFCEPAPRHAGGFAGYSRSRSPSFMEEDTSDKHPMVEALFGWRRGLERRFPLAESDPVAFLDFAYPRCLETLLAVDEAVSDLVETLDRLEILDDTYVLYLSDNGVLYGEHGIFGRKNLPYEESLRIPMLIRGPGIPAMSVVDRDVLNIDIVPTIADLAGIPPPDVDGRSFSGLVGTGPPGAWRESFLAEHVPRDASSGQRVEISSLVTSRYFYTEWGDGVRELYDRVRDPHQLENIYDVTSPLVRRSLEGRLEILRDCVGSGCRE